MKTFRALIIVLLLLLSSFASYAQYTATDYLDWTKKHLDNGNCDDARETYALYKEKVPQGNAEVERRIAECKNVALNPTQQKQDLTITVNGVSFKVIYVQGGTFTMGDDNDDNAKPSHKVTVNSFYMGETEVTQALWKAVMGNTPPDYKGADYPIVNISWEECQRFCAKLNEYSKAQIPSGYRFVLPTEAEWEYAARGGNKSQSFKYAGSDNLYNVAWFEDNSNQVTHKVKTKYSNELGLYDMSGNVWEWCGDWVGPYFRVSQINPIGSCTETERVRRGGSYYGTSECLPTVRGWSSPNEKFSNLGFRLVLKNVDAQIKTNDGFQCGMNLKDMDNHSYKTIYIGSQCWMAQNLRTECDRDGKKLNKNDFLSPAGQPSNVSQYGYLYDWQTAMIVCPQGWHLPNGDEWRQLINGCEAIGELAGGGRGTWVESSGKSGYRTDFPGDYSYKYRNVTGFSALPAGSYSWVDRDENPWSYEDFGRGAYFWSATESFDEEYYFNSFFSTAERVRIPHEQELKICTPFVFIGLESSYYSVRCVHD